MPFPYIGSYRQYFTWLGVAFTAYGVHWFALGWKRYIGSSNLPDAFMALGFLVMSVLGAFVFGYVHDYPVMILFIILTLVYATEAPARFLNSPTLSRLVSLWQFIGGWWLMYLTIAAVVDLAWACHYLYERLSRNY